VVKVKREEPVLGLFTDILEAARRNPPALQQVISAAAGRLLAHIDSDRQSSAAGQAGQAEAAIQEAIRRMNTQTGAPLDLGGLARDLHVSYTWFRRAFLQRTGLSPHQYHLHLRLARARAVLAESALTVRQAAFEAGFESEQYFCRLFKSKTGLTPGAWRQRMRQG
jgi:transcriptional regulator GlxA family with amidase domain